MENKFLTMYGVGAEIDTATGGAAESWAVLGEGIENLGEALNEVVYSGFYLHNEGYGNSEVAPVTSLKRYPKMLCISTLSTRPLLAL